MSCPHTVAIVMDGNRRWAKKNNLPSASGHRKGIETLIDIVKTAKNNSIKRLVVYAFSTENWSRENFEVNALMNLINFGADVKLDEIKAKYIEHNITSAPYLVLKANNGTYGMGVISVNSPDEIKSLNRKNRNKLFKGKSSTPIESLIIQEGIPSIKVIDKATSEEVIYNVNGTTVGGFYRMHNAKSDKDILNSKGMQFKSFCKK